MISWGSLLHAQSNQEPRQPPPQSQQPQQPPDSQAPPAQSQQQPDQQTPNQNQPSQSQDQAQPDANGSREFVGTVVKQGSKYMFQEAATGTTYDIDHQDEVKKFEGKKVRVHGTLDPNTKTIHVQ